MTGNGAVLSNLSVSGSINVVASNVTIKNVLITTWGEGWAIGLSHTKNVTISNVTIAPVNGQRLVVGIKDVYGDATGTQVLACNIAHTTTGIQIHGGLVANNYIHDMAYAPGDHLNGFTTNGGFNPQLTIRHNTIFNQYGQTDAISLFEDFGVQANRTIEDNLLAGGGYVIYGGSGDKGQTSNIKIVDNRISTIFFPNGGSYGPLAHFDPNAPGNVWSGNVWDNTGQTIADPD